MLLNSTLRCSKMRINFVITSTLLLGASLALSIYLSMYWYVLVGLVLLLTIMGYVDMFQKKHAIRRIYPVVGRLRYVMEELRPKMYQYFIESDIDGRPFKIGRASCRERV